QPAGSRVDDRKCSQIAAEGLNVFCHRRGSDFRFLERRREPRQGLERFKDSQPPELVKRVPRRGAGRACGPQSAEVTLDQTRFVAAGPISQSASDATKIREPRAEPNGGEIEDDKRSCSGAADLLEVQLAVCD